IGGRFNDIYEISAGVRLRNHTLRHLPRFGAPDLCVNEWKIFLESLNIASRVVDPRVGIPEHLAFLFRPFDHSLVAFIRTELFERAPDLFGAGHSGGKTCCRAGAYDENSD